MDIQSVLIEPQSTATPKRSWKQLFSRSSSVPSPTNSNIMSRPNSESQEEVQSSPFAGHSFFAQSYDNPINFGLPSPFILPNFQSVSSSSYTVPPLTSETMLSYIGEAHHDFLPEVPEIIEDPFYDPDPVYLLGPVLESLEKFQLDMGTGVATDRGLEKPRALKNIYAPAVVNRPSPIEPPTRVYDEKHFNFSRYPSTPVAQDMHTPQVDDFSRYPTTLGQDGFGLVGSQDGWLLPPELNRSNKDDLLHLTSQNTAASIFTKDDQVFSSIHPPHVLLGGFQNCGTYAASLPGSRDDPRLPKSPLGPMAVSEGHCSLNPLEETSRKDKI
ncbi:hypothetical protein U1Q18_008630 [Sarracenia purpurea var. burkii]